MKVDEVRITAGLRVGFWRGKGGPSRCFDCRGYYTGPDLGDHLPGTLLEQQLMEGTLRFRVGVLFRPDLGRRQSLETILILVDYVEEMFDYEDWTTEASVAEG